MMYNKLIKNLRHDSAPALQNCEFDFVHAWMLEAADAIKLLVLQLAFRDETAKLVAQKLPKWIPVTERLPESGIHVLLACKCGSGSYVCDGFHTEKFSLEAPFWSDMDADYNEEADEYYFPEGWWEVIKNWDDYSSVAIADTVTHWMQLPQPPKDGET